MKKGIDFFLFDDVCALGDDGRGLTCTPSMINWGIWVCSMASSWRGFKVERRGSKEINTTI